jgi:hypothetical protein
MKLDMKVEVLEGSLSRHKLDAVKKVIRVLENADDFFLIVASNLQSDKEVDSVLAMDNVHTFTAVGLLESVKARIIEESEKS